MRVFGEMLLIAVCLLHLLGPGFGYSETCKPDHCWDCAALNSTHNCTNGFLQNCTEKDFNVTIDALSFIVLNSTLNVDEGLDVTLTCLHNLTNGSISWQKDGVEEQGENKDTFKMEIIIKSTVIVCKVSSDCGNFNSTLTITVNGANNLVAIILSVAGAAAVLMMFAIGMKIVQRRGQVQSQARKRQRQQNMENIHSTVNTVTSYY